MHTILRLDVDKTVALQQPDGVHTALRFDVEKPSSSTSSANRMMFNRHYAMTSTEQSCKPHYAVTSTKQSRSEKPLARKRLRFDVAGPDDYASTSKKSLRGRESDSVVTEW